MARKKRNLKRTLRIAAREKEGARLNRPHDEHLMQMAGSVEAQVLEKNGGGTYGERTITSQKRYFKVTRRNLIEMLDDAYGAGQADKGRWAEGMLRSQREHTAQTQEELNAVRKRCRALNSHNELLMNKLGVRTDEF